MMRRFVLLVVLLSLGLPGCSGSSDEPKEIKPPSKSRLEKMKPKPPRG
jgi:hypothetical protein